MAKHDDIAALRETAQYPAVERREAKRKAVARIAVRPFGDYQIVADVERRQHRRRRDAERSEDQAAYRPGKQDQGQDEPDEARRALLFGAFRSGCGLTRAAAGEGRDHPAPVSTGGREGKGGVAIVRPPIMCPAMADKVQPGIQRLDQLVAAQAGPPPRLS